MRVAFNVELIIFRLEPDLDQAATSAEPVAQREAASAMSHGMDPLVQSHCFFHFAFSPSAIVPA
ncbi:hypothetical protein [Bradyrhizobium erythrophlei]|uniref:hypothetical protein n=1 Tax=Bradyrhizobium erythrophlei TaxID=1437360 RepID=UPI0012ABE5A0|nr:hypothetical protein [Bradyrhizobium erythrophlei]